jgi:iron(II)-dependent oxidoreductase
MATPRPRETVPELYGALVEIRARLLDLVADLDDEQMMGPRLPIVNPLRWEIGHVGWFQEFWILRTARYRPPILEDGDRVYDSAILAHDARWETPLLTVEDAKRYLELVLGRVLDGDGARGPHADVEAYFLALALTHECMHAEAITYTRQTLSYPPPPFIRGAHADSPAGASDAPGKPLGDTIVPGGRFLLGSGPDDGFVFDNEQWAHEVEVAPLRIARTATSNGELRGFVEDGGYRRRELWSAEGWDWRAAAGAEHPVSWSRAPGGPWMRRVFDEDVPLDDRLPALHVNWYEAEAYCRWAGRRLPTEAEWELAATAEPVAVGVTPANRKRRYPWGDDPPSPERANLDWRSGGVVPVDALPAGDSAFGCRQMIGNVWEWTASDFLPYPRFERGPYAEYSAPWFGDHKVLRGGCWATSPRLIRAAYRNFYKPDRRDVWAGFRTCALE